MTLKDAFKTAINEQDWSKIKKIYKIVCKEDFEQKEKEENITNSAVMTEEPNEEFYINNSSGLAKSSKRCSREPLKISNKNSFVDDGTISANERVDKNPMMRKLHGGTLQRKNRNIKRQTGQKVDVICSSCGKSEKISSVLAVGWDKNTQENRYKCNDCCSKRR